MTLRVLRSPLAVGIVISACISLFVLTVRSVGGLEFLELVAYDWCMKLRPAHPGHDSRIAIVGVTEEDVHQQDRWPLTDATVADVLKLLIQYQPRAIGLDIYRDIDVPPGQEELKALFRQYRQVVTVMSFGDSTLRRVPPPSTLTETSQVGFNDLLIDSDGGVRRVLLFLDDGEKIAYSFALRLALLYLEKEGITPEPDRRDPQLLRLGSATLQPLEHDDGPYTSVDARGYQILLDFNSHRGLIPHVSVTMLLSGKVDPALFTDKVVLIGVMAPSAPDLFHLPSPLGGNPDRPAYGVEVHAQIVSQLLRSAMEGQQPLVIGAKSLEVLWIAIWGLMGGVLGLHVRSPWRYTVLTLAGPVALSVIGYWAYLMGWWVPIVPPALNWLISAGLVTGYMSYQEQRQRILLMQLFSRHVAPEVFDAIWYQRDKFLDGGRPRSRQLIATVLFLDLEGYTGVAEKLEAEDLMGWLNTYLETMARVVMNHKGIIDEYTGDGLGANFGMPFVRTTEAEIREDAVNAVRCALTMSRELNLLRARLQEQSLPVVGMRIGIFTGPVMVGCIGSAERLQYTAVGDTVNTAKRIESLVLASDETSASSPQCRILIGESTLQYVDGRFHFQRVGHMTLKGKEHPVNVYRVIADSTAS